MPGMSYATLQHLTDRYGETTLRLITDPAAQAINAVAAQQALTDASDEIDLWIGKRYELPLMLIDPATGAGLAGVGAPALVRCCCDVAVYRLQTLRPQDDIKDARQRYDDAVALLKNIAKGDVMLPFRLLRLDAPATQGAVGMPVFDQPTSLFGRENR